MIDVSYPQQKQPPLVVVVHFPSDIRWKPNWMPGGDESWEAVAIYDAGGAEIFSLEKLIYIWVFPKIVVPQNTPK